MKLEPFGVIIISCEISHAWARSSFSPLICSPRYITEPIPLRCNINRAANDLTRQMFFQKASLLARDTAFLIFKRVSGAAFFLISSSGFNHLVQNLKGSNRNNLAKKINRTASKSNLFSSTGSFIYLRTSFTFNNNTAFNCLFQKAPDFLWTLLLGHIKLR